MNGGQSVIKVFLVNGESRSVRLDERMDVTVRGRGREGARRVCWVEGSFMCIHCKVCDTCNRSSMSLKYICRGVIWLELLIRVGVVIRFPDICGMGQVCEGGAPLQLAGLGRELVVLLLSCS